MSAFCSMFSQLLKLFPRTEFQALAKRTHAELREICGGLRSSEGKLKHLGIAAPSRSDPGLRQRASTVALYRAVFEALLLRCQPLAKGRRKFRFKNKLVSLDSTVIERRNHRCSLGAALFCRRAQGPLWRRRGS